MVAGKPAAFCGGGMGGYGVIKNICRKELHYLHECVSVVHGPDPLRFKWVTQIYSGLAWLATTLSTSLPDSSVERRNLPL